MSELDDRLDKIFPRLWSRRSALTEKDLPKIVSRIIRELEPLLTASEGDAIIRDAARNPWSYDRVMSALVLEANGTFVLDHSSDDYVLAHLSSLTFPGMRDYLLELGPVFASEVIWRFFEIPGGGEVSLANFEKYSYTLPWSETFLVWSRSGAVPRDRILTSRLEALNRDFGTYTAGWYSQLFTKLAPSLDELSERQPLLRRLLASPIGPTVTLAVSSFAKLHRANLLDVELFVVAAAPALRGTKSAAVTILAIARDAGAESLYEIALEHPHRDVQSLAAKWLIAHGRVNVVETARSTLAPSVLADAGLQLTAVESAEHARPDPRWRLREEWPDSEVVERLAVLLEDASDPLEVESALAVLARLTDFDSLSPLKKSALRAVTRGENGPAGGIGISALVGQLVLAANQVDRGFTESWVAELFPPLIVSRFEEVRQRVLHRLPPHVLLATPVDSAGWLGAVDLVDRLTSDVWGADLTAALLRLAPESPDVVIERLDGELSQEVLLVISYALGGAAGRIVTPEWWVAAAQSRDAAGEHPALLAANLDIPGQGRPVNARLELTYKLNKPSDRAAYRGLPVGEWRIGLNNGDPRRRSLPVTSLQPTVFEPSGKQQWSWEFGFSSLSSEVTQFVALMWPHSAELVAYAAISELVFRSYYGTTSGHSAEGALWGIQNSPGAVGELTRSAIVLGLSAKDTPLRRQAAEVFADVVPARTSVDEFARTLTSIIGVCTLTRLADAFADAAGLSDAAARTVTDVLVAAFPSIPRDSAGLSSLLSLLDDELLRVGRTTSDAVLRDYLAGFTGSSKAAKVAKTMLAR